MLLALLGNILVLVVLFSANSTFQQSSSFFFASLCLADLGITIFGKYCVPASCSSTQSHHNLSDDAERRAGAGRELGDGVAPVPAPHLPGRHPLHRLHPPPRHHQLRPLHCHRQPTSEVQGKEDWRPPQVSSNLLHSVQGDDHPTFVSGLRLLAGRYPGWVRSRHVRPLHHPGASQLGSQTPREVRVPRQQNILSDRSHGLLPPAVTSDDLLLHQVRTTSCEADSQILTPGVIECFRVYLETRRLEKRPLVTKCSLNLFVEHSPGKADDTTDSGDPDIIIITSSEIQPIQQISEDKTEFSAANKLFLVMAGFLICWLPYFLWLPFSTLLVNISDHLGRHKKILKKLFSFAKNFHIKI